MTGATLDDVRDLSARSRRSQATALLAIVSTLALLPFLGAVLVVAPAWYSAAMYAALAIGGGLFVLFAFVAGQERGAFRKLMKRMKEENRSRTLVPEGPLVRLVEKKIQ